MNMYAYCGNNPVSWIDPWGLCKEGGDPLDYSHLKGPELLEFINGLTQEQKNVLRRKINEELGEMYWELQKRNLIPFHYQKLYIPFLWNECNQQALNDYRYLRDLKDWQYWNVFGYVSGSNGGINHSAVQVDPKQIARWLGSQSMALDSFTVDQGLGFLHYLNVLPGQGPGILKWFGPTVEVMTREEFKEKYPNESR